MKNIIITTAAAMLVTLVIATVCYENANDGIEALNQKETAQKQALKESEQRMKEQEKRLQPIHPNENNKKIGYSLQNDKLQITFDKGKKWGAAPIEREDLFAGEYNGDKQELIPQSFVLTEKLAAFFIWYR
ncbi:hypothetical protein RWE15_16465 [Virgibacillus halophilus]|uniref:Lipoprotein n=1 Tax=Tigheibacillus halophilus TaxID=361280 RepID=A0ABU5C8Q2_9BACI|nr:hypothetical protein [Virgibacillus halophilus]